MSSSEAKTAFGITRQAAQSISNIGGNQTINYGDRSRAARIGKVLAALGLVLFLVGLALLVLVGVATTQEVLRRRGRSRAALHPAPRLEMACGGRAVDGRLRRESVRADPGGAMTTFNIGSQNAGSIQNVGGHMVVDHGIHGSANVHVSELRGCLAELKAEVDRLGLPTETRAATYEAIAEAEAEAAAPEPRSKRIGDSLRRVTKALGEAGALTNAVGGILEGALNLVKLLA